MRDDNTTNSHYLTHTFLLRKLWRMYFLNLGVKGLRATFCKNRESPDNFNFFESLIISPKIPFDELFPKAVLKRSGRAVFGQFVSEEKNGVVWVHSDHAAVGGGWLGCTDTPPPLYDYWNGLVAWNACHDGQNFPSVLPTLGLIICFCQGLKMFCLCWW